MRLRPALPIVTVMPVTLAASLAAAEKKSPALDTAKIEELTGMKGTLEAKEGVFKVSMSRADLTVSAGGVHLTRSDGTHGLGHHHPGRRPRDGHGRDMVMLQDQVNPGDLGLRRPDRARRLHATRSGRAAELDRLMEETR
jgi:hypothetical protein